MTNAPIKDYKQTMRLYDLNRERNKTVMTRFAQALVVALTIAAIAYSGREGPSDGNLGHNTVRYTSQCP